MCSIYSQFSISDFLGLGSEREDDRRREERRERGDREPLPKKGNTVYVYGHSVTEETLRKAFSNFGNIVNISMETERQYVIFIIYIIYE